MTTSRTRIKLGYCLLVYFTLVIGTLSSSRTLAAEALEPPPGALTPREPSEQRRNSERPKLPDFSNDKALPELSPSPATVSPDRGKAQSTELTLHLRTIRIVGNTVLPEAELKQLTSRYVGRAISETELEELRYQLSRLYTDRGYINSGVVIPDQDIHDGVLTLNVVEGRLTQVEVSGTQWLRSSYIEKRLDTIASNPLNINSLQERLQILNQDRLITWLNSELVPGNRPGESRLKVTVTESRPYAVYFTVNNYRAPSIGSIQGVLDAIHWNLTGYGDSIDARYAKTAGLDELALGYSVPLTASDTRLRFAAQGSNADVVEAPFNRIDVQSEARALSVSLSHPVIRTLNDTVTLDLNVDWRRTLTFAGGIRQGFAPGVIDGEAVVSALRFGGSWVGRSANDVYATRVSLNQGLDIFGSTINEPSSLHGERLPDSRFLTMLVQAQWAHRFSFHDLQSLLRADAQFAFDPLLPSEQFAVGGALSVRGYRQNQLVRDQGLVASAEFRLPILRNENGDSNVQLAAFSDFGRSWDTAAPAADPEVLISIGAGLRWQPSPRLLAELYGAIPFQAVKPDGDDLQDVGVYFQVSYQAL